MDPRSDRSMDPRGDDLRRMDMDNRNMDPRKRNNDSRRDMNMDQFSDRPFDNQMDPRNKRKMQMGMEQMDGMEQWHDGRDHGPPGGPGFPRPGGFRGRSHHRDNNRGGDWRDRDEWDEPMHDQQFGMESGRGGMMRGRGGRGRGDFAPRGRGGRGGGRPHAGSGPPGVEGTPFIDDDVLNNFGGPGCVVAVENLHFKASVEDIINFFRDFGVEYEDVIRRFDDLGRPTGDARVAFQTPEMARDAAENLSFKTMMGRTIKLHVLS